jgi:hypothetical protein
MQQLYSRRTAFLTQPLYLPDRKIERNVVVAFHTSTLMEYKLPSLLIDHRNLEDVKELETIAEEDMPDISTMSIHVTKIDSLKTHCELLSVPLLVYDSVYCDIGDKEEIFECFYYNAHTHEKNNVP